MKRETSSHKPIFSKLIYVAREASARLAESEQSLLPQQHSIAGADC